MLKREAWPGEERFKALLRTWGLLGVPGTDSSRGSVAKHCCIQKLELGRDMWMVKEQRDGLPLMETNKG